jgi:hypothetical protein
VLHLGGVEEVLRLGNPASEGISRGALTLPGECCHTNLLMSRGGLSSRKWHDEGVVGSRNACSSRSLAAEEGVAEKGSSPGRGGGASE